MGQAGLAVIAASFRLTLLLVIPLAGFATERNDWAEGSPGLPNGATRDFYNRAAALPWIHFMGDWWDANGKAQGEAAFATAEVVDDDRTRPIAWEVTKLVRQWLNGSVQNQGFFLRAIRQEGHRYLLAR